MGERPRVLLQFVCGQRCAVDTAGELGATTLLQFPEPRLEKGWRRFAEDGSRGGGLTYRRLLWASSTSASPAIALAKRMSATPGHLVLIGGSEADVGPAVVGLQDGVECDGQGREVAVIDPTVFELLGKLLQHVWPVPARRRYWDRDLDAPLDDLDG
jgi:hypothetical protein